MEDSNPHFNPSPDLGTEIFLDADLPKLPSAYQLDLRSPPGKAPYGYRRTGEKYVIDRATAPTVRGFYGQFLRTGCLRGSVRYVAQQYGKTMAVGTGKRWLTHPVYRGHLLYQGKTIIPHTHEPLLQPTEAAQIDRLLRRNSPLPPRRASSPHGLSGLVKCGQCQRPWQITSVTRPRCAKTYRYVRPLGCPLDSPCHSIAYETLWDRVIETLCRTLEQMIFPAPSSSLADQLETLTTAIAHKQALLAQLPDLETQGILDPLTHQLRRYTLQGELAKLYAQRDQLPPDDLPRMLSPLTAVAFWQDLSEVERRFYLREFVERIDLHYEEDQWNVSLRFAFAPPSH